MRTSLFDFENWREIGATLARNKTRTFMTAFGIFWGTAMLAMLWGGSKGGQDLLMRNFQGFATNMGFTFSGRTTMAYNGFRKGERWALTIDDVETLRRNVRGLEAIAGQTSRSAMTVSYGTKSTTAQLDGTDADIIHIMEPLIYEGRFLNAADDRQRNKVCVLGKKVAAELFGVGSPLGKYVGVNGVYYQVVGVAGQISETGNSSMDEDVMIPLSVMMTTYNVGQDIDIAFFTAKDGYTPSDLEPQIRRLLRGRHPNLHPEDDKALIVRDISKEFQKVDNLFLGLSWLALLVGGGTLMAGVIGVGNIMWIIVKERTREIGIRRAIGATPRNIIVQILSESVILTLIAGTAGVVFASLILAAVKSMTHVPMSSDARFDLSFSTALTIIALFVVLGTAAGFVPALKAMRIKPVEAMNDK